ncbi:MAG: LytR C-terminal domain-containing protein [Rhodothermales bacterium]
MTAVLVVLGIAVGVLLYGFVARMVAPRVDPLREDNPAQLVGDIIQVEVRNGCGISGLAHETTMFLRRHGFDVVDVGDYTSFDNEHSLVIDRVGDLESARKVATVLGIPEERIRQDIQPEYYLDASVVIGKDYESLRPFKQD